MFNEMLLFAEQVVNQPRDLVVALVAIGLGVNIIYTVLYNSERCFQLSTVQMMERNFGRNNAMLIVIGLGSLCIVMGLYLIANSTLRKATAANRGTGVSVMPFAGIAD